jgi:type VI secretion system secreted protein Hcp
MSMAARFRSLAVVCLLVVGFLVTLPSVSWAALNAYLQLPDCNGTVTVAGLQGAIQLNGFTSKVANMTATGAAGVGRAVFSPIQVLKDLDKCSPHLFLDVVSGHTLQTVTILFTRTSPSGKEEPFFKITLTHVTVSSVEATTVAGNGTDDLRNIQSPTAPELNTGNPTSVQEIVTLTYAKIQLTELAANVTTTFDVAGNRQQ